MEPHHHVPPQSATQALRCVTDYFSRPQQFVAVGEARAAFRDTLERAQHAHVILTTQGEPAMALVPFTTLEALRGALLRLLADAMETSFHQHQAQGASPPPVPATSEEELEALVADVVRLGRRQSAAPPPHHAARP